MRPEVVFICQYKLGGVQNYYYNLLKANAFEGFHTRVIYTNNQDDNETKLPHLFQVADEEYVFNYRLRDAIYYTFRRLKKFITDKSGLVFTNFAFELGCLHNYATKKTVAFVVHDEWYIQNAIRYSFLIDVYVTHNASIYEDLRRLLPDRKEDIHFLPYGVFLASKVRKTNLVQPLKIIFIGNLHDLKGIYDLPVIDDILKENGVNVEWTIIGDGPEREKFSMEIENRKNFKHLVPEKNEEVLLIASRHDIFLLPSRLEGMPVALLEAMSVGLVPVIGNFNEGIKSVVTHDIGYVLPVGKTAVFADTIMNLNRNRELLDAMGRKALEKIANEFNAEVRAKAYQELIKNYKSLKSERKSRLPVQYGSGRLDKPYIPNWLVKGLRQINKFMTR